MTRNPVQGSEGAVGHLSRGAGVFVCRARLKDAPYKIRKPVAYVRIGVLFRRMRSLSLLVVLGLATGTALVAQSGPAAKPRARELGTGDVGAVPTAGDTGYGAVALTRQPSRLGPPYHCW